MPITRFIWGPSGVGLSEHAWRTAESTGAAWVGNDPTAHVSLLRRTVVEELAVGLEQRGTPRDTMEKLVANSLRTWGLEHVAENDPMALSTGQTRRLAIASALLIAPDSLVLDCPLDGLDALATRLLSGILADFPGDVTVYARTSSLLSDATSTHLKLTPNGDLMAEPAPDLELPELAGPGQGAAESLLTFSEVSVRGGLGPFSFDIPAGQITHLAGENGSGKTSLMLAALGLIEHSGRIEKSGAMSSEPSALGWAPTAMDHSFLRRTVLDEVAAGSRSRNKAQAKAEAQVIVNFVGIEQWADTHPLDVPSSDRRLVLIAAAMAGQPDVLLIDEPTVGLDATGHVRLRDVMARYVAGELASAMKAGEATLAAATPTSPSTPAPLPAVLWTCHDEHTARALSHRRVQI